ncbi:MAG: hypothetical protein JO303_16755, partial [Caulobacteraceae bacterium]|nr:hypothetical protein [Caulobacteraceae bacterium]
MKAESANVDNPRLGWDVADYVGGKAGGFGARAAGRIEQALKSMSPLFIATVVIPTTIAVIYFGLLASDVYISESRFIIRAPEKTSVMPTLGGLLKSSGLSSGAEGDVDAVTDFIHSRDALSALNQNGWLQGVYSNPKV